METILPYVLYGARRATTEPAPAASAAMKTASMPYRSQSLAGDHANLILLFLPLRPFIHDTTSWNTPRGHITEQYTRPKTRVSATRRMTTPRLSASTAGRNCILAIHPNHAWSVPVKSRKSNVIMPQNIMAAASLAFFSIKGLFLFLQKYIPVSGLP